jgi:prepilin-type N-terminal cleavage/methylation domain-containing protein
MRAKREVDRRRRGLSLLEMMTATAIMATLMAAVVVVVRSGYEVWNLQERDIDVAENGYAVLRHFVRQVRQAEAVTSISAAGDTSGYLSLLDANGGTQTWTHDGAQAEVLFDDGGGSELLAREINQLSFAGYEADGVTPTTAVGDIQVVRCTVVVTMPHDGGEARTISCRAWLRSW